MRIKILFLVLCSFLMSCDSTEKATVSFKVQLHTGTSALALNSNTTHPSGLVYQPTLAEFILSEIEIEGSNGWQKIADFYYSNAAQPKTITADIPVGHYTNLRFRFGVHKDKYANVPNTLDFRNMEWPTQLGGGYHYMKWEGTFTKNGQADAFAFHVGPSMGTDYSIQKTLSYHTQISATAQNLITLKIDLHDFLKTPNLLLFENLPGTIMDNPTLQAQIQANAQDAFSL